MTAFRNNTDDFQRLDFELLKNGATTLYYRHAFLSEDIEWLTAHNYRIDSFDCTTWKTDEDMYAAFAMTLDFPDYFGRNLAALEDCLCDLNISEDGGRALVFHRYDAFESEMPEIAWSILDIIEIQSRLYLLFGKRLLALVQSDNPKIKFNGLGAQHANWNRREWLNTNRGL